MFSERLPVVTSIVEKETREFPIRPDRDTESERKQHDDDFFMGVKEDSRVCDLDIEKQAGWKRAGGRGGDAGEAR